MNPYESERQIVSKKERYILVHSYLYYELSRPVISDKEYDEQAMDLLNRIKRMREEDFKKTDYYYVFDDFDGKTGYDLYDRLCPHDKNKIEEISCAVLRAG